MKIGWRRGCGQVRARMGSGHDLEADVWEVVLMLACGKISRF